MSDEQPLKEDFLVIILKYFSGNESFCYTSYTELFSTLFLQRNFDFDFIITALL